MNEQLSSGFSDTIYSYWGHIRCYRFIDVFGELIFAL